VEDLVDTLTFGNPAEVKIVLATVALALGAYQLVLAAVGFRWVRLPFLSPPPAFRTHRAIGDTLLVVLAVIGVMCLALGGFGEDEGVRHGVPGLALAAVLGLKVAVVRRGLGLGIAVFTLLATTWALSA
jgi:hypothetical protein